MFQSLQSKDNSAKKNNNSGNKAPGVDYAQMMQLQTEQSRSDLATQMKENPPTQFMVEDEEEMLQAKLSDNAPTQMQEEEEEEMLQAKSKSNPAQLKEDAANSVASTSSGTTTSLPKDVNAKMENAFGTSFSDVTIKKDSAVAEQMNARAFTKGNEIQFKKGEFNPFSTKGQELIGHELTHVVQQRAGRVKGKQNKGGLNINADKSLEDEADFMGAKAALGQSVEVNGKGSGIQRAANENIEREYTTTLKSGISKQPNPERDCYGYALEYADNGRGNRNAAFFLNLNGNAPGGDAGQVASLAGIPLNWSARISGAQWDNVGGLLQSGKEILGTISNEGTNHWVNITRIKVLEKVTRKGKVKKRLKSVSYWDPIRGHVANGKTGFNSVVCLY